MKKLLSLLILMVLLSSCSLFSKDKEDDVSKAKEELLGEESTEGGADTVSLSTKNEVYKKEETTVETNNIPTTNITTLTAGTPLIELEDLSNKDFYAGEFYINGNVLGNVDKIEVSFSNDTSTYPVDLFKLKQYKLGDKAFKYMASSKFKTLDFGLNTYVFTAYNGDSTYKVKVEINIPEKEVNNPVNPEEVRLTEETENMTDVKDLKIIEDENVSEITCNSDVLTKYIIENYSYSYWNSCFPIKKDKSIGFYVLRLEGENYFYEKHYIDYEKKTHGVLLLETGVGVTKDSIREKNYELKGASFDSTLKADLLFKN